MDPLDQFDGKLIDGLKFCQSVYSLFEEVRSAEDGPSRLRMRPSEIEKKLLEELLPISYWLQRNYKPGRYISVRWFRGNQSFDAQIEQTGWLVDCNFYPTKCHLEVTCAMHPNDYLQREMLEKKGHSFSIEGLFRDQLKEVDSIPVGYNGDEFIDIFADILINQISKKAEKNYPEDTLLIVKCTMNSFYFLNEWERMISIVNNKFPTHSFSQIYIYMTMYRKTDHILFIQMQPNKSVNPLITCQGVVLFQG